MVVKVPDVATAVAVDAAHKAPVATVVEMAAATVVAKVVADVVETTTRPAPKARAVPSKVMAVAAVVKAVDAHPWVTHNPAAMKADLAAAWASALPALRQVANQTRCAPVSI